jgi:hypothetical protein
MAVLNSLLRHEAAARAIPELGPVVAKHDGWLAGHRFLLVPYHMIGARSMEAALRSACLANSRLRAWRCD